MAPESLKVKNSEYKRLASGKCLVVEINAKVGDIIMVDKYPSAPVVDYPTPTITTRVGAVRSIVYTDDHLPHPDGFTIYSGHMDTNVITYLVSLFPVKECSVSPPSSPQTFEVIDKWRKSVETMARKLKVCDRDFQKTQVVSPIACHFDGNGLDDDKFCVLTYKEQVACLGRLSETVYTKLNQMNGLQTEIIKRAKALEGFGQ